MSSTTTIKRSGIGHDHDDHSVTPNEIAVGVIIGRVGEFFDFFVFGIATVLVFPGLFFPFASAHDGLVYSFLIFSLGFIARIPGAIIFRVIHDRYGRASKLTGSLFLLGTSTVCIAFLPGFETIGATAIWLLAALRFTQGIAVGGAWDGLPSLLALTAPEDRRGWYAMIAQIGAPIGFIVATGLFAYLYLSVSEQDFLDWGWRFAFFTAFAINVVTLFARLRMSVTPEYEALFQRQELTPSPMGELFRSNTPNIILGSLVPLASYALFHLVTIFPLAWVLLEPERFSLSNLFMLQIIGGFLCIGTMMISGKVADRVGRGRTLYWGAVMIAVFCIPAPFLGDTVFGARAFIPAGFMLLGFSLAQAAGAVNYSFDAAHRYSGAIAANEFSWLAGAAFAPLVALLLADQMGNGGVALYLLSGAIATLAALRINMARMKKYEQEQARSE